MKSDWILAFLVLVSAGCASLEGPPFGAYDPFEPANVRSYAVSEWIDGNALRPVARGYQAVTWGWFRTGVGNVFANLREVDSALNGFLQLKPERGVTSLVRILVNTSIGLGGWFDVAARTGLTDPEEDFGQTLAVAGVTRTRYLYIPVLGPSSARDLPGSLFHALLPRLLLGGYYPWWIAALDGINSRAAALTLSDARDTLALDPYVFTREAFYQRRKFLIFDGDPPREDPFAAFDEIEDENDVD